MLRIISCMFAGLAALGCAHGGPGPTDPTSGSPDDRALSSLVRAAGPQAEALNDQGRRALFDLARGQACPCPETKGSLLDCIDEGACVRAPFAARAMARFLSRGDAEAAITGRLLERFGPRDPETLDLSSAPCRGPAKAPVTLVVWSDFQCPYCALGKTLVDELVHRAGDRLRVCFKHWPLRRHPRARPAALAAVAAQAQDRFWPMHDLLFAHQDALEDEDLTGYARELHLDLTRFERDRQGSTSSALIDRDAAEAERLRLGGTPSFLVNGRRMTDPKSPDDFMDWIDEAEAEVRARTGSGVQP